MGTASWHGSQRELVRLEQAVDGHCECIGGLLSFPAGRCSAHQMLTNQSTLDHLLYVYRMRKLFIRRELYALPVKTRAYN